MSQIVFFFNLLAGFTFAVEASYIGNNIVLAIDSSSEGTFCCQLDIGTCILCELPSLHNSGNI